MRVICSRHIGRYHFRWDWARRRWVQLFAWHGRVRPIPSEFMEREYYLGSPHSLVRW